VVTDRSLPGGSAVKNLPAVLAIWVQSLGQEDPLEKEMAVSSEETEGILMTTLTPTASVTLGLSLITLVESKLR